MHDDSEMNNIMEAAEENDDDRTSTSTLVNQEKEKKLYVDLEKNESEALGAQVTTTTNRLKLFIWMVVNTLATIGIVRDLPIDDEMVDALCKS